MVDLNLEGVKKVAEEIEDLCGNAIAVQCNVADEESVRRRLESFGTNPQKLRG